MPGGGGVEGKNDFTCFIDKTKDKAVSILTSLADGYNKYHAEDKVILYSQARSDVSHTQSLILVLSALDVLPENAGKKIAAMFDDKIRMFNGLIKKMEDKA